MNDTLNDTRRERDLVLAPNAYALVSDETKGDIVCYVGPYKASLAKENQPVIFNNDTKEFENCSLDTAIQTFAIAPEGWYGVLKNPAEDLKQPQNGTMAMKVVLNVGRKINMQGPFSFALWPGQMVKIIPGHHLHSNQYLLVRVYDEAAAKANAGEGVIAKKDGDKEGKKTTIHKLNILMGALSIIRGTDVSFYIPPTGIEVVPEHDEYIRNAVTLERLEYCILLDESGDKSYVQGPAVVFPNPTERFIERNDSKKYRAFELNENMGLHLKVITDYEEDGNKYSAGDELFITGKDQKIYYPREEHMLIKYGEQTLHFAVAVPKGEGRYVLDKDTGEIALESGPQMLLPNPTNRVIIKRILKDNQVELWFPNNVDALEYNQNLRLIADEIGDTEGYVETSMLSESGVNNRNMMRSISKSRRSTTPIYESAVVAAAGPAMDEAERRTEFTPPRTLTLDTKYDGAVNIDIWPGFAVQRVSKTGERKVIVGPQTIMLEYDESLQHLDMSTGKPKTDHNLIQTVYLRIKNNRISDIIEATTKDLVDISMRVGLLSITT